MAFSLRYLIARGVKFATPDPHRKIPVYDPAGVRDRLNRTFRRRLSDRVEDLFQEACLAGDTDTAGELLTVLVNLQERRSRALGSERRINAETVAKAREELTKRGMEE